MRDLFSINQSDHKRLSPIILITNKVLWSVLFVFFFFTAEAQTITSLSTAKAIYSPNSTVNFSATTSAALSGATLRVRYYHLSVLLSTVTVNFTGTSASWTWTTPGNDHRGYLVSVELMSGATVLNLATIGVNVSTNHSRFPIYGFLSKYPSMTDFEMDVQMNKINRYHINWIQFYDWMDTHHDPLAGTATNPSSSWNDLANRLTVFETVKGYIDRGHNNYNMKSMLYELVYGVYSNVWFDPTWHLYNTSAGSGGAIWSHPLPSTWETSALNMMNLNNTNWRNYFFGKINEAYNATNLHFDGWHMDQIGDFGFKYTSTGSQVDVAASFPGFIQAAKNAAPSKLITFNAVNTYGQSLVANSPIELLYTEMWDNNQDYASFRNVIITNEGYNSSKKNIFAAYVGKSRSGSAGTHSTGAVLLADATIFALGGAHLELGEHLLCNEYFPNNNLSMTTSMQNQLTSYYDFMVAYENILRDGRTFNGVTLSGTGARYWPPVKGLIATVGASWNGNQVFHCLNYTNANTLNWQDDQPEPTVKTNIAMSFPYTTTITRMWVASPDINKGVRTNITFNQSNGVVTFTLPSIKYWTMIVAETGATPAARASVDEVPGESGFVLEQNSPNPFTNETTINFTIPVRQSVQLHLYDGQGNHINKILDEELEAGTHAINVKTQDYKPGLYICHLVTASGVKTKKMIKIE